MEDRNRVHIKIMCTNNSMQNCKFQRLCITHYELLFTISGRISTHNKTKTAQLAAALPYYVLRLLSPWP